MALDSNAQSEDSNSIYSKNGKTHLGIGTGLTYGGLGARLAFSLHDNFGLIGGLGYNLVGLGYNAGVITYFPSSTKTQAYFCALYGYNSVIKVEGLSQLDESYNGPSFGFGMALNSRSNPGNYWDIGIIVPVRSSDFKDDWDIIKNNPSITVQSDPWPILVNIGYNFRI